MAIGRSLDANRGGIAYEETLPGTRLALTGQAWRGLAVLSGQARLPECPDQYPRSVRSFSQLVSCSAKVRLCG